MRVTFQKEYKDQETGRTYKAQEQAEIDDAKARKLIQEGTAKESNEGQQPQR